MPFKNKPDIELLSTLRNGDKRAYTELWKRHWSAGVAAARKFSGIADAEDLTQEAFTNIYESIDSGKGPVGGFRPYLYRTIRNVAISSLRRKSAEPVGDTEILDFLNPDSVEDHADQIVEDDAIVELLHNLPERWQEVLWYTVVEQMPPREVAPLVGLSPNATSALAVRARDGLRSEWLKYNERSVDGSPTCDWVRKKAPSYTQGRTSKRENARIQEHLDQCQQCRTFVGGVTDFDQTLRAVLWPLVLGVAFTRDTTLAGAAGTAIPERVEATKHGSSGQLVGSTKVIAGSAIACAIAVVGVTAVLTLPKQLNNVGAGTNTGRSPGVQVEATIQGPAQGTYQIVPDISGTAPVGSTVLVYARGKETIETVVKANLNGRWVFTPDFLPAGTHTFTAQLDDGKDVVDIPGNAGPYDLVAPALTSPHEHTVFRAQDEEPHHAPVTLQLASGTTGSILTDLHGHTTQHDTKTGLNVELGHAPLGSHALSVRFVDPHSGRLGVEQVVNIRVSLRDLEQLPGLETQN